jgi:Domain of unknown function (DUF4388)
MDEALQGLLDKGVVVNVMQYMAMNQATGCLTLRIPQGEQGQIYFEDGTVVHVSLGSHTDVKALSLLLHWEDGSYSFKPDAMASEKTIKASIERILLEASLHADVAKKHGYNPFYEDSILTARPLERHQVVSMSIRGVQLLPHLDGLRTLGEIAYKTGMPLNDVIAAANELNMQGLTDAKALTVVVNFISDLKTLLTNIVGPMGEIMVDDTLYDHGISAQAVPQRIIPQLLRSLEQSIKNPRWRDDFGRAVISLCQRYGVSLESTR